MSKVFLLVLIFYNDQPSKTYHYASASIAECYKSAQMLAINTPSQEDNVVKYMVGCSFEEPVDKEPS